MADAAERGVDETTAWRSVPQRVGLRAKCSFLLSVLAGEQGGPSEQAVALLALVDDLERITDALDHDDAEQLRGILHEVLRRRSAEASWTTTVFPDDEISGPAAIDGTNVRRVVVPPGRDGPSHIAVAHLAGIPRGVPLVVIAEYTFPSDDEATIEVVDGDGSRLGSIALRRGHNQLAIVPISPDAETSGPLTIAIVNHSGTESPFWYGATVSSMPDGSPVASIADLLSDEIRRRRAEAAPSSVLAPVTREPLTLRDVDRLMGLRDRFRGERIFIMGNGPSLNRTPLDLLENDHVFAVNRVSLLFDRVSWRPTFFTAFDVRVVPDNQEEFAELDIPYKFFSARYKDMMGEKDNHYWHHTKGFYEGFEHCFEPTAVYSGFGGGGTIGVLAIELAYFMGFREIYLIGTDVSYSIPATVKQDGPDQFGDGVKLELTSTQDDDPNHFDPRYFGKDKSWHNPNVREMKIGFSRAAAYIERRGGVLRNATVGGELDEVARVDFESLF